MPALKQQPEKKLTARASKPAHPVQPSKEKADYEAMRKDIMAKFPKTLARLAE